MYRVYRLVSYELWNLTKHTATYKYKILSHGCTTCSSKDFDVSEFAPRAMKDYGDTGKAKEEIVVSELVDRRYSK